MIGFSLNARKLAMLFLGAALFLSGLIFMPHAAHAFWAPETLAARMLAPLGILVLTMEGKRGGVPGPNTNIGLGLLYLLMGWWFLSAGFAFRKDLAARELGFWLSSPLVFWAAWRLGDEARARGRMVYFIMAAGALQALYGLAQSSGLEPFFASILGPRAFGFHQLNWAVSFGGRAGAFFGNPNFLGGHLAMLLPLAVAMAMDDRVKGLRQKLRWALAALLAAGLAFSQTRGAWLGAGLGLATLGYAARRHMPGLLSRNKKGMIVLASSSLLALAFFFATHSSNLGRFSSLFKGDEEISRRLHLMRHSLALAVRHPLLGVGPGNFRVFFPSVEAAGYKPEQLETQPYVLTDHAHNDLIQMAVDAGFPAALLLILLMAWLFKTLWKGIRGQGREVVRDELAPSQTLWLAGIMGSLLALAVHGLANFPFLIAPTQMSAWALAAVGLRLALPRSEIQTGGAAAPRWRWLALVLGAGLWLFSSYDAGRGLVKDALWWVAEGEHGLKNYDKSEQLLFRTLELDRREDRLWYLHGISLIERNYTMNATGSLKEAVRLNPHMHQAMVQLGRAQVAVAQYKEAEENLARVAAEAPNLAELWEPLAAAYFMQGKYDEAVKAYDWAIFFHAASAAMYENKAAALGSLGRLEEAIKALNEGEKKEPGRAKNSINRAITHIKMGFKQLAALDIQEAKKRDPKDPQINDVLKVLR